MNSFVYQKSKQMNYLPGDFSFIQDEESRLMLKDAYHAVCTTHTWFLMSEEPSEGFMFTTDMRYNVIENAITYKGHSGTSYGWTMRNIQFIARKGWNAYYERMKKIMKGEVEEEDPIP